MNEFDRWSEEFAAAWVRMNPQLATAKQYFSDGEQTALDRELALSSGWGTFYGGTGPRRSASLAREGRAALERFARDGLSVAQRTSAAALAWSLDDAIATEPFATHRFVFSQIFGFHVTTVNFLAATHPIRNGDDAANYLARLRRFPTVLDEGIAEAQSAAHAGIVPPTFILERTIEQLETLTSGPPEQHVLLEPFVERMRQAGTIAPQAAEAFEAEARRLVLDDVVPALLRVRRMLVAQLASSNNVPGAWALPDGQAYYARQIATYTGTSLSAQEIHEIGRREVERIEAALDRALRRLGYAEGSIRERLAQVNEMVRFPSQPDPRRAILERLQTIVDDAARRARDAFHLVPEAPVVIRREPAFSEKSAAAHYTLPAPDGSSPGTYWVPLADLDPNVPWIGAGLKSTAYHEAIPGHHFQLAIEQESRALPYFRKRGAFGYNAAFNEGWALYAERLCAESGWYEDDLPAYIGYLQLQLFRARRLVVDTGLHELRWTREEAIAYGFTAAEVERYVTAPGQACSYMIGQLRILELREKAQAALGARFAIADFHDLILSGGTLPLDVFTSEVERWIVQRLM